MCHRLSKYLYVICLAMLSEMFLATVVAQGPAVLPKFHEANEQKIIARTFNAAKFEIPLTLYGASAQPTNKVTLTVGPIARSDGHIGTSAAINSPMADQEFTVPANGFLTVPIRGELPEFNVYKSWLMLTSGDERAVYNLTLERRAWQLVLLGAVNNRLDLSTSSRNIQVPLTFKLADGQSDLTNLQLSVSSLAREDGRALERETLAVSTTDPVNLRVGEFNDVQLVGRQMQPGKYWAKLTMRNHESAQVFDLQMNCVEPTQRISVVPITNTSAVVWFWTAQARAKMIVDETAGRSADVYQPHVESIERLNTTSTSLNLADVDVEIVRDGDATHAVTTTTTTTELTEEPVTESTNLLTADPTTQPATALTSKPETQATVQSIAEPTESTTTSSLTTIAGRDSQSWTVTLGKLSAGKYKVRMAVAGPDLAKVVTEFEVKVRHRPLFAFLPIGIGVFVSFLLNNYLQTGRQNQLRKLNLARTEEQIEKDLSQWPDSVVWPILQADLRKLRDDLKLNKGSSAATEFDAALVDIVNRRTSNVTALESLAELNRILSTYPADYQAEADEFTKVAREQMVGIDTMLSTKLNPKETESTIQKRLVDLQNLVKKVRCSRLSLPITALLQECTEFKEWIVKDATKSRSFLNRLDKLIEQLTLMKAAADNGELSGLERKLITQASEYSRLRIDDLEAQLNQLVSVRTDSALANQWNTFDLQLQKAREALENARNVEPLTVEQASLIRAAALSTQQVQVEYLQVAVDNSCPGDIDRSTWQVWVANTQVNRHLKSARDPAIKNEPAEVLAEFQLAQAGYLSIMHQSIAKRIEDAIELVQKSPVQIEKSLWNEALQSEDFKSAIEAFQKLREKEDPPYQLSLQRRFVLMRMQLVSLAVKTSQGLIPDDQPGKESLTAINDLLSKADQKLSLSADTDGLLPPPALREAGDLVEQAQAAYRAFAEVSMNEMVAGRYAGRRSQTTSALLTVPNMRQAPAVRRTDVTIPPPPPNRPEKADEILRAIVGKDTWVTIVTMVLAVLGGFSVLYLPNEIWGVCSDYLTAILWGFGLNEAGNGILTNLANKGIWPKGQA